MLRIGCLLLLTTVVIAPFARADTFDLTQVNVQIGPNIGLGDNVTVTMSGPDNALISTYGGIPCFSWCADPQTGASVSVNVGSIFWSGFYTTVQAGGTDYLTASGTSTPFYQQDLDISGFQVFFPSQHQAFTACGSASMCGDFFGFTAALTPLTFNVLPTQGTLCTSWSYTDGSGWFYTGGTFTASTSLTATPEPGSLYLLGSGLLGLFGLRGRSWLHRKKCGPGC